MGSASRNFDLFFKEAVSGTYRLFRKRSCDKYFVTAPLPYLKLIAGCEGIVLYFICDIFINDKD